MSSLREAFRVCPRICKPIECRDNLKIRNTRTKRTNRSTERGVLLPESSTMAVMKYGRMAGKEKELFRELQCRGSLWDLYQRTHSITMAVASFCKSASLQFRNVLNFSSALYLINIQRNPTWKPWIFFNAKQRELWWNNGLIRAEMRTCRLTKRGYRNYGQFWGQNFQILIRWACIWSWDNNPPSRSIMLRGAHRNLHLLGHDTSRVTYSIVNQTIQANSIQ